MADSDDVRAILDRLPPELLAEVHSRLPFLKRLAFAMAYAAPGRLMRPEAPWLVLPGEGEERATLFSLADGVAATVRASDPAMRGHVVLGSQGGWLVTADEHGALRMANPATGAQADLPAIAAIPLFLRTGFYFTLDARAFMRGSFYRKVVLSASPRPGSYAAMLILPLPFGVPAFVTTEDPAWRLAPSYHGVEDAIHHDGRFYSISYSGDIEAWDRNAETGEFTSAVVGPRLPIKNDDDSRQHRKYIAVGRDGRLMAIVKCSRELHSDYGYRYGSRKVTLVSFTVQVLDQARGRWEAADMGDTALFVGVNGSICVSTREHPRIRAGCVYFTQDELRQEQRTRYGDDDVRCPGVYSLSEDTVERIEGLGIGQPCWPPAAWFTPSFT
ncbi:hypothetical protein ACP70R_009245 [Stipagrostis hirtigluma subsp. patula]